MSFVRSHPVVFRAELMAEELSGVVGPGTHGTHCSVGRETDVPWGSYCVMCWHLRLNVQRCVGAESQRRLEGPSSTRTESVWFVAFPRSSDLRAVRRRDLKAWWRRDRRWQVAMVDRLDRGHHPLGVWFLWRWPGLERARGGRSKGGDGIERTPHFGHSIHNGKLLLRLPAFSSLPMLSQSRK